MASVRSRGENALAKLDHRVPGDAATYYIFTGTTTNSAGQSTPTFTTVSDVKVRPQALTIRDRLDLVSAGLTEVETAWNIRRSYFSDFSDHEPTKDDELHLAVSGFKYVVEYAQLDRVQANYVLYVRRLKFQS